MDKHLPRKFGVIDETGITLYSPRVIDEGPFDTLEEAFDAAATLAQDGGYEELAIVLCRYSKKHECWVERVAGSITISLHDAAALIDDENEAIEARDNAERPE